MVFNPLSGRTHLLDIVAGHVLMAVHQQTRSADELCASVTEFLEVGQDTNLVSQVTEIVSKLDDMGLIEPVEKC